MRASQKHPIFDLLEGTAAVGTFHADLAANTVEWSDEVFRRYGVEPSDDVTLGETWQRIYPEDRANLARAISKGIASGTGYEAEFRVTNCDGEVVWNSIRACINGHQILGVVFDVTAGKKAESKTLELMADLEAERAQLRSTIEQLRLIEETVNAGTWEFDVETGMSHWPPGISALWGLPRQYHQVGVDEFLRRMFPEDRERVSAVIQKALATGEPYHVEFRVVWPDNSIHWLVARGAAVADAEGKAKRVVGIALENTQQVKIEAALRQSEKLAAAGRLAATIAHEINNPLEAITNLLYLALNHSDLPPVLREHLQIADQELSRVSHIARQTLGFYKESATPEDVDVSETVEQVLEVYARKIGAKEISVAKDFDRDVRVRGSKGELRQVVSNIVLNAVDAVPQGGRIVVRVRRYGHDTAQFSVTDNGSGIAPENRAKIFQPFFTTKRDVGTGLGLWVSKGIVEKHGGRIQVRSRRDAECSGTMFLVKLPAAEVVKRAEAGQKA